MPRKLNVNTISSGNRASGSAAELPKSSIEAQAIKKALGVPLFDRSKQRAQEYADSQTVERAIWYAEKMGNTDRIDEAIAEIGIDRFLAAAPPDVAAKMRAQIRKAKAAAPKPKPKPAAKIDGIRAWAIRQTGTQAQIDALDAQEAAEEAAERQARSPEGAAALASAIRRNTALANGNGRSATPAGEAQDVWSRAIAANNPTLSK